MRTIYFGGGTPSVLTIEEIARIIAAIKDSFDMTQVEEVTLESNPEDLTPDWVNALAQLRFFNRLSVGIQSFNDRDLRVINRRHDARQAAVAIENAAAAGFNNISVDLMMGLPGQSAADFADNLRRLGELSDLACIKHLSCYELTVEPDTILDRQLAMGRLQLPDEEVLVEEYNMLSGWCSANGFEQYEVSNYSKPGFRSRHNSRYWNRTPYIGVGAGAHSFDGSRRRWNVSDAELYSMSEQVPYEEELLTSEDSFNEYVMTALRTSEGLDKSILRTMLTGKDLRQVESLLGGFVDAGLLTETPGRFMPTAEGLLHADGMACKLFVVQR